MKTTDDLLKALSDTADIKNYINENAQSMCDGSIADYLQDLLAKKQITKSAAIKKAELSETYAYQIFSGTRDNPSRNWVISIAFGMGLNLKETQQMLKALGLTFLYAKHKRDCILMFAINHQLSVPETNELLYENNEETL
ncbi:MAG: XRE family transcriptional regulator [Ruminococcus sp.]|jgi:hypothetical protein|nr:XRE family transcriptional regulator [Ruminococcus sp.]